MHLNVFFHTIKLKVNQILLVMPYISDQNSEYNTNQVKEFGGWDSDEEKLRRNLLWTPKQILTWLEDMNQFNHKIRTKGRVLSKNNKKI